MLTTVYLNYQFALKTDKINNIFPHSLLPAKFFTIYLSVSQMQP